jgi:hypothetical protein
VFELALFRESGGHFRCKAAIGGASSRQSISNDSTFALRVIKLAGMPSNPRTPKSTVKVRRLPKVGDVIMIPAIVTRVGHGIEEPMTVGIKASGHLTTARAEYLLKDDA